MASLSKSATAATSADLEPMKGQFFVDSDEELLDALLLLVSNTTSASAGTATAGNSSATDVNDSDDDDGHDEKPFVWLPGVGQRIVKDWFDDAISQDWWQNTFVPSTLQQAEAYQFVASTTDRSDWRQNLLSGTATNKNNTIRPSATENTSVTELPALFQPGSPGHHHVQALVAILAMEGLAVDAVQAIQLTTSCWQQQQQRNASAMSNSGGDSKDIKTTSTSSSISFLGSLGTRFGFLRVLEFAHRQKWARLQIVTELLRLEQQEQQQQAPAGSGSSVILPAAGRGVLDQVDQSWSCPTRSHPRQQHAARGLFRWLLTAACRPLLVTTSRQLQPAQALFLLQHDRHAGATAPSSSLSSSFGAPPPQQQQQQIKTDPEWQALVLHVRDMQRCYHARCRVQAMEALLVLLYGGGNDANSNSSRMACYHRYDLWLLLTALLPTVSATLSPPVPANQGRMMDAFLAQQQHQQHPYPEEVALQRHWTRLIGLVCAEAMVLWRVSSLSTTTGISTTTIRLMQHHPLLIADSNGNHTSSDHNNNNAMWQEWQGLVAMVLPYAQQVQQRKQYVLWFQQLHHHGNHRLGAGDSSSKSVPVLDEYPEAWAILAMGLLLQAATNHSQEQQQQPSWMAALAAELCLAANEDCEAFDTLRIVMQDLLRVPVRDYNWNRALPSWDVPYDIQAFVASPERLLLTDGKGDHRDLPRQDNDDEGEEKQFELSATTMTYASLGLELVLAAMVAFQESLQLSHAATSPAAADNVDMICTLTSVLLANSPMQTQAFLWTPWEQYTTQSANAQQQRPAPTPFCQLLEAAHGLAVAGLHRCMQLTSHDTLLAGAPSGTKSTAVVPAMGQRLQDAKEPRQQVDALLQTVNPLMRLLAGAVYDPASVTMVLNDVLLPSKLLAHVLHALGSSGSRATWERGTGARNDSARLSACDGFLQSLDSLIQVGNNTSCRAAFRQALELDQRHTGGIWESPRHMLALLQQGEEHSADIACLIWDILARLAQDAPIDWMLVVATAMPSVWPPHHQHHHAAPLQSLAIRSTPTSTMTSMTSLNWAALSLVHVMIQQSSRVLLIPRDDARNEATALQLLSMIDHGLQVAEQALLLSLSKTARQLLQRASTWPSTGATNSIPPPPPPNRAMDCFRDGLQQLRVLAALHPSMRVRQACQDLCYGRILPTLSGQPISGPMTSSGGLGAALMYYATVPVTLSLMHALAQQQEENEMSLWNSYADHDDRTVGGTGLRQRRFLTSAKTRLGDGSRHAGQQEKRSKLAQALVALLTDAKPNYYDEESLCDRGWIVDISENKSHASFTGSILRTARSALQLLQTWMDIVIDDKGDFLAEQSPYGWLTQTAMIPVAVFDQEENADLAWVWEQRAPTNVSLLSRYWNLQVVWPPSSQRYHGTLQTALSASTWRVLWQGLMHAKWSKHVNVLLATSYEKVLHDSESFCAGVRRALEDVMSLASSDDLNESDAARVSAGVRALHLWKTCIEVNPSIGYQIMIAPSGDVGNGERSLGDKFFQTVRDVLADLEAAVASQLLLFSSWHLVTRMRIGVACLDVLRSVWLQQSENAHVGGSHLIDDEAARRLQHAFRREPRKLCSDLLLFLIRTSLTEDLSSSDRGLFESRARLVWLAMTRVSFDILTYEVTRVLSSSQRREDGDLSILQGIDAAIGHDLTRFLTLLRTSMDVQGIVPRAGSVDHFVMVLKTSLRFEFCLDAVWTVLVDSNFMGISDNFQCIHGPDVTRGLAWIASVAGTDGADSASDLMAVLTEVAVYQAILLHELSRLKSCRSFVASMLYFNNVGVSNEGQTSSFRFAVFVGTQSTVAVAKSALDSLKQNLQEAERGRTGFPTISLIPGYAEDTTAGLAALSLSLLGSSENIPSLDLYDFIPFLEVIIDSSTMLCGFLRESDENVLAALHHLMGAAVLLVQSRFSISASNREPTGDLFHELAAVAVKIITILEESYFPCVTKTGTVVEDYVKCLSTCVALISTILAHARVKDFVATKLLMLFRDLSVVKSLVRQAGNLADQSSRGASYEVLMSAMLEFFTDIAGNRTFCFPPLLNEMAMILRSLARRPALQPLKDDAGLAPRGYLISDHPSGTHSSSFCIDDPWHKIWLQSIRFVRTVLRSSEPETIDIALNFIKMNRTELLKCLTCAGSSGVTRNLLLEVSLILSVVSELCQPALVDSFMLSQSDFFNEVVRLLFPLLSRLCCFLGASSFSRDLFKAVDEFEADETFEMERGSVGTFHSPIYRFLASGVSYARHEAIRFAYFASRYYQVATKSDMEEKQIITGQAELEARLFVSDTSSLSSFENSCRASVANAFAYRMELEAAECVFYGLDILWKTHPAATSFVTFTQDEALRLDSMVLVKPGMKIAFRQVLTPFLPLLGENKKIMYGQVLHSDTVNRQWSVRVDGSHRKKEEDDNVWVSPTELAGIQDPAKLRCLFQYGPAPEDHAQLESSSTATTTTTLGHIILCLRWCGQIVVSTTTAKPPTSNNNVVVVGGVTTIQRMPLMIRLAELACALLIREIETWKDLHCTPLKSDACKLFLSQLLDLFGEQSDLATSSSSSGGDQYSPPSSIDWGCLLDPGKLKHVVAQDVWEWVREHLRSELLQNIPH